MNMRIYPREHGLERLAAGLRPLGHTLRLGILRHLRMRGATCVCALASALGTDQPTLSRHLRILKDAGLLDSERSGANILYGLNEDNVGKLSRTLRILLETKKEEDS